MRELTLIGLIAVILLAVAIVGYVATTNSIIKEQEAELRELRQLIKEKGATTRGRA